MTAQIGEQLIFKGGSYSMSCLIDLPQDHPRIHRREMPRWKTRDEKMAAEEAICWSTACWRNYIGTWEIHEGALYLRRLIGCFTLQGRERLLAEWFTGILRIDCGECLSYVHAEFESVYEREVHISITKGYVTKIREITNDTMPPPWREPSCG